MKALSEIEKLKKIHHQHTHTTEKLWKIIPDGNMDAPAQELQQWELHG